MTAVIKKPYIPGLLIIVCIALPYIPALQIYLIGDDFECLNAVYSGWHNPAVIFQLISLFFRPILQFSYLVKYTLFTTHAAFYIAALILLHLANVYLLYMLLIKITGNPGLAAITSVLFGTSPMYSEATLWSGGHSDSLLLFFFLSIFLLLSGKAKVSGITRQFFLFLGILGAAGSKGTWIILPLLTFSFLLLVMNYPLKKASLLSSPAMICTLGYLVIFVVLPYLEKTRSAVDYAQPDLLAMLNKFSYLLYRYVELGNHFYGYWWQIGGLFLVILGVLTALIVLKNRIALWGMSWLFLAVLITLPVKHAPSRYNYLPLVGFWILVTAFFGQLLERLAHKFTISRNFITLLVLISLGCMLPYHIMMLQWEIHDYRKLGNAHKTLVDMYTRIQDQIVPTVPIVFINSGTRKPIVELSTSLQGYLKLLYRRPHALWELIYFAPLANFAGTPFKQRMMPIEHDHIGSMIREDFQIVIFTDRGFFLGNPPDKMALRQFYSAYKRLPDNVEAYQLLPTQDIRYRR